ncbi:MAG: hypothetical protein AB7U38_08560, partial [Hyphomicrobiales bacterium]
PISAPTARRQGSGDPELPWLPPKGSLESDSLNLGNPKSPHNLVVILVASRATFNLSGMCSLKSGWISEQTLIDAAVGYEIAAQERLAREIADHRPKDFPVSDWKLGDQNPVYTYENLKEFYQVNHNCCKIEYFFASTPKIIYNSSVFSRIYHYIESFISKGLIGFRENVVYVGYQKYRVGDRPYTISTVFVSFCAELGDRFGSNHGRASINIGR